MRFIIGSTKSFIPLWIRSMSEIWCLIRKICQLDESHYSAVTVEPPQIDIDRTFCAKKDTKGPNDTQDSFFLSLRPFLLLLALLAGAVFYSITWPYQLDRNLSLICLNNPTEQVQEKNHRLILTVSILFNAFYNNISKNNKKGGLSLFVWGTICTGFL